MTSARLLAWTTIPLPAVLLAALASSSSTRAPDESIAPALSSAPSVASTAAMRVRAPTRPSTTPQRASKRGKIVDPWGD